MSSPSPSTAPVPLHVHGLSKHFGKLTAVDNVSLEVKSGECFGLLGPNGAGKSTLIRCIVGRAIADTGELLVFGAPAASERARTSLGWIPQELALYSRLSCRENLLAFGRYQGLGGGSLKAAVDWCLEWAALTDRVDELVKNLSGGMKRRLNMAAGLIHRPKLVLMDEPTVGVDPQSRNRIFEMIEALQAEGVSTIYTTHYMEEAARLCDRIAIMDHGRIIALGTHNELVHASFGSRSEVIIRFEQSSDAVTAWVAQHGGRWEDGIAMFAVDQASDVGRLLDASARAGLELQDVSLRKPNLESVFLHLTGRELRD